MKINLKLSKDKKYLLACSYGPDSMCLFDLLLKGGYKFEIAHVNYHLREEEPKEMEDMKKICKNFKIPLHIIDVYMPSGVNEEGWARNVRYDYFSSLGKKLNIKDVLIAHNEDDLIETFCLQLKRKNIVSYYGLKEVSNYKDVNIVRPLLKYKKSDLLKYCDENKVHYGIDLSNFDTSYERNEIRKNLVSKMSELKRKLILDEIKVLNEELKKKITEISKFIEEDGGFFKKTISNLNDDDLQLLLIRVLELKEIYYPISKKFVNEFKKILKKDINWHKELKNNVYLTIDYGYVNIYELLINDYKYTLKDLDNSIFKLNSKSKMYEKIIEEGVYLKNGLKTNEVFKLQNGVKKKIGRCFIDWKVPFIYRRLWPGIYNKNNELIYVPHYQEQSSIKNEGPLIFDLNHFIK